MKNQIYTNVAKDSLFYFSQTLPLIYPPFKKPVYILFLISIAIQISFRAKQNLST